ncbi:MAG: alginate export family protein [Deltaproteobacteria bacterium]|nr:alginate export family protein [Deltaproteobacteria bacterium]
MKRSWVPSLLLPLLFLAAYPTTLWAEVVLEQLSPKLSVSGSLRVRGEFWHWFASTGGRNNDYRFVGTVARGALQWTDAAFEVMIEGQNSALLHLPDDAAAPAPQGALGLGAIYFVHNRRQDDTSVFLKQGFLTLKRLGLKGLTLKGGRFEFAEGLEVMTQEPTLDWLKTMRLGQRLIGPFGFSHVGRAFDGLTASWTRAPLNFTLLAAHPTQGGFDLAGMKEISEIDLLYAAVTCTRASFAANSEGRLFYIYYADGRRLLKSDNRPARVRSADRRHIAIHTEGGHWISVLPTKLGPIDFLAWGALQHGEWGLQAHFAWAWDLEAGWQPRALPWKPWLRIGYGRSSGDDSSQDGDHETFFQILPTVRLYSFSTFYNLMNSEDGFAQFLLRPHAGLVWRTDFHNLRVSKTRDLWYQGAGATLADRDVGFGFPGRPVASRRDLFRVLETSFSYDWSKSVNLSLYYSHVFGGSVVRSIFAGDQADFGYVEVTLKL